MGAGCRVGTHWFAGHGAATTLPPRWIWRKPHSTSACRSKHGGVIAPDKLLCRHNARKFPNLNSFYFRPDRPTSDIRRTTPQMKKAVIRNLVDSKTQPAGLSRRGALMSLVPQAGFSALGQVCSQKMVRSRSSPFFRSNIFLLNGHGEATLFVKFSRSTVQHAGVLYASGAAV